MNVSNLLCMCHYPEVSALTRYFCLMDQQCCSPVLWMSETMAVAMVMPHCNILLQPARLTILAAASKLGKTTEEGGEGRRGKRTD